MIKNFRKEACLRIYYNEEKSVKSWEGVKKDETPYKGKIKIKTELT
ncbi:DUF1093 domain-containing protein (plasmid) [Bacillus mycoides]|nr:DUF1093 domain-containing protein [Bacillus mycoides]